MHERSRPEHEGTAADATRPATRDPVKLERGDVVWNRYQVEEILGQGGMGLVVRARDRVLDRVVAVKLLAADHRVDVAALRRLRKELLAARDLRHPHVVDVFDYHEDDTWAGFAMECVEGETLARHLAGEVHGSPLASPSTGERLVHVASIVRQLAAALDAVHEAGLVHGDVKPSNVMLTSPEPGDPARWTVKLLDFGLARAVSAGDLTTAFALGTPAHMAPELLAGERPTSAADVYALAKLVYQMLTGRLPSHRARRPSLLAEGLPESLDDTILSGLDDAELRPHTAGAIAAAFEPTSGRRRAAAVVSADVVEGSEKPRAYRWHHLASGAEAGFRSRARNDSMVVDGWRIEGIDVAGLFDAGCVRTVTCAAGAVVAETTVDALLAAGRFDALGRWLEVRGPTLDPLLELIRERSAGGPSPELRVRAERELAGRRPTLQRALFQAHGLGNRGAARGTLEALEARARGTYAWCDLARGWAALGDAERCRAMIERASTSTVWRHDWLCLADARLVCLGDEGGAADCLDTAARLVDGDSALVETAHRWIALLHDRGRAETAARLAEKRLRIRSHRVSPDSAMLPDMACGVDGHSLLRLANLLKGPLGDDFSARAVDSTAGKHRTGLPVENDLARYVVFGDGTDPERLAADIESAAEECPCSTVLRLVVPLLELTGERANALRLLRVAESKARESADWNSLAYKAKELGEGRSLRRYLELAERQAKEAGHWMFAATAWCQLLGERERARTCLETAEKSLTHNSLGVGWSSLASRYADDLGDLDRARDYLLRAEERARTVNRWADQADGWLRLGDRPRARECLARAEAQVRKPYEWMSLAQKWRVAIPEPRHAIRCLLESERTTGDQKPDLRQTARTWVSMFGDLRAARRCLAAEQETATSVWTYTALAAEWSGLLDEEPRARTCFERAAETATRHGEWLDIARASDMLGYEPGSVREALGAAEDACADIKSLLVVARYWLAHTRDPAAARACIERGEKMAEKSGDWLQLATGWSGVEGATGAVGRCLQQAEAEARTSKELVRVSRAWNDPGAHEARAAGALARAEERADTFDGWDEVARAWNDLREKGKAGAALVRAESMANTAADWVHLAQRWGHDVGARTRVGRCLERAEELAKNSLDWWYIAGNWARSGRDPAAARRCLSAGEAMAVSSRDWSTLAKEWYEDHLDEERARVCLAKAEETAESVMDWQAATHVWCIFGSLADIRSKIVRAEGVAVTAVDWLSLASSWEGLGWDHERGRKCRERAEQADS